MSFVNILLYSLSDNPCGWLFGDCNFIKSTIFTTLTFKSVEAATIDGTHEIEVEVSDFNKTCELLNACGINHRGYQENRRTQYILDGVEIDIDSWPLIPTYVEIEGKDEESVLAMVDKLELDKSKLTALDVMSVYDQVYHIDMNKIKELRF